MIQEQEIERKFLVVVMPDISSLKSIRDERYYLFSGNGIELKIQLRGNIYQLERMAEVGNFSRTQEKVEITQEEFEKLRKCVAGPAIIRDSYLICKTPQITLKVYRGEFEGLVRAEVEFESVEDARNFQPLPWFGDEITDSPLGSEAEMLILNQAEFRRLLGGQKQSA